MSRYLTDPEYRARKKAASAKYRKLNPDRVRDNGREAARRWREANSDRAEDTRLRSTYDITLQEYKALQVKQAGGCAICGVTGKQLVVDHDHSTNKVRGLLCHGCNVGIGLLGDTHAAVLKAANYLRET